MRSSAKELARVLHRAAAHNPGELRAFAKLTDIQVAAGTAPVPPGRKATIFAPARTSMQSGTAQTIDGGAPNWRISFNTEGKWINPLIGWTSTADHLETMARQMYFGSKEEAVAFVERQGIPYEVAPHHVASKARPKKFQGYGDNYSYKKKGLPVGGLRSEQLAAAKK